MVEIFTKVVKDDGTEEYQPLSEWKDVEIPDDVVRSTAAYKKVLDESVTRRQQIKELKTQIETLSKEDEKPANETPPSSEGLNFKTRDELINFIHSEISQRDNVAEQAKKDKETAMLALVEQHKLSRDVLPLLLGSGEPEKLAQYLGQEKLRFDGVSGGEQQPTVDSIIEKVAQRMNLNSK